MANLLLLKKFWCFFFHMHCIQTYIFLCILPPISIEHSIAQKSRSVSLPLLLFECHTIPFQIYLFNIWQIDKVIHSGDLFAMCVDALGCTFFCCCFFLFFFVFVCFSLLYFGWSFGWRWNVLRWKQARITCTRKQSIQLRTIHDTLHGIHTICMCVCRPVCINYNNNHIIFEWRAFPNCSPKYKIYISLCSNSSGWSLKHERRPRRIILKRFDWKWNTWNERRYSQTINWRIQWGDQIYRIYSDGFF